jgi:streptogramin lyase
VPIAVAYGCDVAPDQSVWFSQLFGHMIGRVDPATGAVRSWRPPFDGPRRLFTGPDNVVWVPGYGSGELGRFDPASETWKVYKLPTAPVGQELPYDVSVDRTTGDVWITGSNSDTLIRFRPGSEAFTVFRCRPAPTSPARSSSVPMDPYGPVPPIRTSWPTFRLWSHHPTRPARPRRHLRRRHRSAGRGVRRRQHERL